jgi:hypothetical protein
MDSHFQGTNKWLVLERRTKDLLISRGFLLQVCLGSGLLRGLLFPGRQRAGGLEHCRKDLLLLSGFLLQVGVGSGLLRGLSFPWCQRAGGTRALHERHAGRERGAKLRTHLEKGKICHCQSNEKELHKEKRWKSKATR